MSRLEVWAADEDLAASIEGVAALADPIRRRLYIYVASQSDAVGREDVASAAGVAGHTAKFHLDRLAADGLLEVEFRRRGERRGPGAGRPAKFYRLPARTVTLSLPPRQYQLASELLMAAVARSARGEGVQEALAQEAFGAGQAAAEDAGADLTALEVLSRVGFRPQADSDTIVLYNCPFDALVQDHRAIACQMNLDFVSGICSVVDGRLRPRLQPGTETCCVRIDAS